MGSIYLEWPNGGSWIIDHLYVYWYCITCIYLFLNCPYFGVDLWWRQEADTRGHWKTFNRDLKEIVHMTRLLWLNQVK